MEMEMEMETKKKKGEKDGCSSPGLVAELVEEEQLPLEIILDEIMCRLPVKPLARFRSVCKIFNSVISCDPRFAILQQKNSLAIRTCFDRQRVMLWDRQDCSAAFFLERKSSAEFSIERINTCPIEGNEIYHEVVASCDGLVCIYNRMTNSIIFWNPLTGETKRASDPPEGISLSYRCCSHGLGYDSSSDDYKLVWIKLESERNGVSSQPNESAVFSLRTNSWRRIQDFPTHVMCLHSPSVFINGALYWIGYDIAGDHFKVVSFCLKREKYSLLNVPVFDSPSEMVYPGIQVTGDKFAAYCKPVAGGPLDLLFLSRDDSDSWTKHKVPLPGENEFFTPLCLLEDVDEFLFQGRAGELGVYHLSDDTFKYLDILGLPKRFGVITFFESLISPNRYAGSKIGKISGMET